MIGIHPRRDTGEVMITCPHPEHEDNKPSCSMNMDTGLWKCHACGEKGDLITIAMVALNMEFVEAKEFISGVSLPEDKPAKKRKTMNWGDLEW